MPPSSKVIASINSKSLPENREGSSSAILAYGTITVQSNDVDKQIKNDIGYWTLFASLATDYEFNNNKEKYADSGDAEYYQQRFDFYIQTLREIGMDVKADNMGPIKNAEVSSTIEELVLNDLKATLPAAKVDDMQTLLDGYRNDNEKWNWNPFVSHTGMGDTFKHGFQMGFGSDGPYGAAILEGTFYAFNLNETVHSEWIFSESTTSIDFYSGYIKYELLKETADSTRPTLLKRLGINVTTNMNEIPIA